MFQDVDATIKAILQDSGAPTAVRTADISFQTPDKDFKPSKATVNLFLHKVHENRELRDYGSGIDPPTPNTPWMMGPAVLRLDCSYVVTAWSPLSDDAKVNAEHDLLGQSLLWLSDFRVVDVASPLLQGGLKSPRQRYPLPISVAQTADDLNHGQFWTSLGIQPRASYSLTVTVCSPLVEQVAQSAVHSVRVEVVSRTGPQLDGRVLSSELQPVADATVSVIGTNKTATTDASGEFSFSGLPFDSYTLRVQMVNRPDVQRPVSYQPDHQVHNIILPGA
jgi:hypothetical protein